VNVKQYCLTFTISSANVSLMPITRAVRIEKALTDAQREVLVALRRYIERNQVSPRYEDLAIATARNKTTVLETVTRLVRKGYVVRKGGRYCALVLTEKGRAA
jgi:DNA-binding MarR family transcriptional regulator